MLFNLFITFKHLKMKKIPILLLTLLLISDITFGCTTAVISGKYTKNGRPMIWKLRDSESYENKMMFFDHAKYAFVGMINSDDEKGEQVWGGANDQGFAIMNSASFNVNSGDSSSVKDQEGVFMKKALGICTSLADFEKLLIDTPKPMGLAAHFGVLDTQGGVAFYEVNNFSFTKFDANDPTEAPNGYIIRTNYSYTGKKDVGYGFIRYQCAQDLFYQADACNLLDPQTIIQDFSRCLKHPVLKRDFREDYEGVPYGTHFENSGDLITRHGSSSMILIEGVKKGEPKDLATIWTQIGYPNTSMAIPLWVRGGKEMPGILSAKGKENCPLNEMALQLKSKCYPIKRSAGYKYLNVSELINSDKTGIIQQMEIAEEEIFRATSKKLQAWRKDDPEQQEIAEYNKWLNQYCRKTYSALME